MSKCGARMGSRAIAFWFSLGRRRGPRFERWAEVREPTRFEAPLTIIFGPATGRAFRVLVSVIARGDRGPDVRALVEHAGRALLSTAVEDRLALETLRGPQVRGFFFRLTDRTPKDDEYRYLIQGAQRLSDWVITFSVLTNEPDSAEARRALEMLRSMEVARGI